MPIVEKKFSGRVVYAGGDDVLAFLPLGTALPCASCLKTAYKEEAEHTGLNLTVSAAILYAHGKSPLQAVLTSVHNPLDDVVKEAAGRDAVALRVEKRSGPPLQMAKPWTSRGHDWAEKISHLATRIFPQEESSYSSRFLYKVAKLLTPLGEEMRWDSFDPRGENIVPLLTAEYLRNRELSWPSHYSKEEIEADVQEKMLGLYNLLVWERRENGEIKTGGLQPEILPLLRFLASKGVER